MGANAAGATGRAGAHLQRRAFLAGGAAGLALPWLEPARAWAGPSGVPADGKVAFKVLRRGAHIGEHSLRFEQDGDNLTVTTEVRITVHIGPVPVYHHAQGTAWSTGRATASWSMESTTVSNVSPRPRSRPAASPTACASNQPSGAAFTAPAEALPLTHWKPVRLPGTSV